MPEGPMCYTFPYPTYSTLTTKLVKYMHSTLRYNFMQVTDRDPVVYSFTS